MKKAIIIIGCIILFMVLAIIIFPLIYTNEYYSYDEAVKQFARGKIITVNNKKIHYIGKGAGKPVIMIHGFLYNTAMWNKNIDKLSKKFKVYAIDLWGWGYSQRLPKDAYSFDLYSRQVIGFMDALKIPKASLVGQSMGGGISVYTAAHNPDRIDRLLLVAPAVIPYDLPLDARVFKLPFVGEFMLSIPGDSLLTDNLKNIFFYDKAGVTDEYAAEVLRPSHIEGTHAGALYMHRYMLVPPVVEKEAKMLAAMGKPILIIHGHEDRAVPLDRSQELAKMWKTAKLVIFEKAGHCPHDEHAERFNRLALDFL
ncbi:MAG: alpha/beta hydrolase [Spirochaetes bacterium]|nr:alpha/beta hydrolase [Spirochaetota bacterium]